MLFIERKNGISLPLQVKQPTSTMDYLAVAPLNAKGTCFRIVVVESAASKTPKHIKTKKN